MRNENLLLAALPDEERERLSPYLKKVVLDFQQVLIEPNEEITDLYFPHNAITSTLQAMNNGDSVETGLMGIEGLRRRAALVRRPNDSHADDGTGTR